MIFSPRLRLVLLITHVAISVGFLGAVVVFFAMATTGFMIREPAVLPGLYLAMDLATRVVIVPLCVACLASGLVLSFGTPWGLMRHWWVLAKLAITVVSTGVLLLHVGRITDMRDAALALEFQGVDLLGARLQLVVASGAAIVALLAATVLSVAKPRGQTRYGWRQRHRPTEERATS